MAKSVEIALRRVLNAYALMTSTDEVIKVQTDLQRYLETLEQGGQTDPSQLAVYGFAYLRRDVHVDQGFSGL
jgi:hypothetical protein